MTHHYKGRGVARFRHDPREVHAHRRYGSYYRFLFTGCLKKLHANLRNFDFRIQRQHLQGIRAVSC